tara:strand:+ start:248 stop:745 length:498 start_codon:yes stop_codon:yes gene_type:complete
LKNTKKLELPFLAGLDNNDQPVFESLELEVLSDRPDHARLIKSPVLARNLAAGDTIKIINPNTAEYELVARSGNLCIRLFGKDELNNLEQVLTSAIEKLGGSLDNKTNRALVYSVHISIGFRKIELLLDEACRDYPETVWYYGNVYDPEDGITPLEWWLDFDRLD